MKLILLFLFTLFPLLPDELTGDVVRVADGDTITILTSEKKQIRIRLDGIDCPEKNQDFGQKAKAFTANLCAGKNVRIISHGEDKYGRILGVVMVGDINVNKELLKAGLAWHYKHFNKEKELSELEALAKKKKIGLWSQQHPIAPWDFRRMKK